MKEKIIKGKRVLITGGAGFIGSNLTKTLIEQDNKIICLDNFSTGFKKNIEPFLSHHNFTLIEGDIRNLETCINASKKADIVLHQAALGSVPRSINDPLTTNAVNINGFLNMLWAVKENRVNRFVYAASSSTYGDHKDLPKVEESIGNPLSPYAVTKYVNELYANVFASIYGIKTIGLRYFNVFGPNQDPNGAYAAVIPKFINQFLNGESPTIYGDGLTSRDFTYIDNVIRINQLAATTNNPRANNQVYNAACGENISLNFMADIIKTTLSSHYNNSVNSIDVKYTQERKGDVKHSLADISKAKTLLSYQPKVGFNEGILKTIQWFLNKIS
ncbi:MAG: SDR family oxidoreductase [Bacteroidia bacterium]|nr:SDR family oxidoreductase [Bacteroidia bacterium]